VCCAGKTALARLAAERAGARLLVINGPDVVSEYYGGWGAGVGGALPVVNGSHVSAMMGGREQSREGGEWVACAAAVVA
jgi:hypothetical protein